MTTRNPSPFTLVVGNDFSTGSGYAFDHAAHVAKRIPHSEIHIVHVIDGLPGAERTKKITRELGEYIDQKTKALGGFDQQVIGVHVRYGRPAREIAQLAREVSADLIVVGSTNGPELKRLVIGSVSQRLLTAAPCPVFVAGPTPATSDNAHEPAIEPPCPDCVAARKQTAGKEWWCARHSQHHAHAHSYSYHREIPMRAHDSAIEPTGVDMK